MLVGTHVIGTDPHFDPFCIWGNDIFLKHGQVKKMKKIVRRNRKKMNIKLFVCALSKTTVNFRMVRTRLVALFFPIHNVCKFVSTTNSELLLFSVVYKQFTKDYLSNYAIQGEAVKVKVFRKDHDELDVVLKIVKDGRAVITKGWTKVVKAFHMKEGSIWAFRFSNFDDNQKLFRLSLYRL